MNMATVMHRNHPGQTETVRRSRSRFWASAILALAFVFLQPVCAVFVGHAEAATAVPVSHSDGSMDAAPCCDAKFGESLVKAGDTAPTDRIRGGQGAVGIWWAGPRHHHAGAYGLRAEPVTGLIPQPAFYARSARILR